jgi:hypothetical protein
VRPSNEGRNNVTTSSVYWDGGGMSGAPCLGPTSSANSKEIFDVDDQSPFGPRPGSRSGRVKGLRRLLYMVRFNAIMGGRGA